MNLKKITHNEAKEFAKTCELWQLNLDKENEYYGLFINGELVSIASYKKIKNEIRIKSNYTLKPYRRKGYMTLLVKYIIDITKAKKYSAYCERESVGLYMNLGFNIVKIRNNKKFTSYVMKKEVI